MKNALFALALLALLFACNSQRRCIEKIKPDCICTMDYDPVCGCNQKTYGNESAAKCAGIYTYQKGACVTSQAEQLKAHTWQLLYFTADPQPIDLPDSINIYITFKNERLEGNGGCNSINAGYQLMDKSLKVSAIMCTKMFCPNAMKWEGLFLQYLEKSSHFEILNQQLEIKCGTMGNLVFRKR